MLTASAQQAKTPLYPEGIPCKLHEDLETLYDATGKKIIKVGVPEIWYYPASRKTSAKLPAILIVPGGGYTTLAFDHEGIKVAQWLNQLGISAFVLLYRLPYWESEPCKSKVALMDATRAIRIIRHRASEWNINPNKVGVMGFSAGGHLAATLSTQFDLGNTAVENQFDKFSSRPDFSILVYPVISMLNGLTHMGSRKSLLGDNPTKEELNFYSNDLQVKSNTPPTLLIHAKDDSVVVPENSIQYHRALQKNKTPTTLHLLEVGGHGFGIKNAQAPTNSWLKITDEWLQEKKFIAD
ncbi:MAG: alpha/beta hydrolase [Flavobacteriaceae bacterium]|nr:alpha/beta hydrolase [Flavobacteriaceae bacterium]MDG2290062.1 alpha/beta hydrolase [Flavobacteriaceae bacterium]